MLSASSEEYRARLGVMLYSLGAAFRTDVTDELVDAYLAGLEDIAWEPLAAAGRRALKECEHFPAVAALRGFAKPVVIPYHQPAPLELEAVPETGGSNKPWGDVQPISNAEMVQVCLRQVAAAVKDEAIARARYRAMQPGDKGIGDARLEIMRHHMDQAHWREYGDCYRKRGEREGHDRLVPVPKGMTRPPTQPARATAAQRPSPAPPPPAPPPPGDEDDDDDAIPF